MFSFSAPIQHDVGEFITKLLQYVDEEWDNCIKDRPREPFEKIPYNIIKFNFNIKTELYFTCTNCADPKTYKKEENNYHIMVQIPLLRYNSVKKYSLLELLETSCQ